MLLIAGLIGALQGCFEWGTGEESLILKAHPLAGRVWDVKQQRFVAEPRFLQMLRDSEYLLLGETHDNPRHHHYQAQILADLSAAKRPVRVYFEMIDTQQGRLLDRRPLDSVDEMIRILEQNDPGWDYNTLYRGVFEQAWTAGFPVRAANLPRDRVIDVMKQGESAIPGELRGLMKDTPLNEALRTAMKEEAIEAHCNIMPDDMIQPMILGQRLRDAAMARALLADDEKNAMKVLMTGSGHARRDRGVPLYLQSAGVAAEAIRSVGMMEVMEGEQDPSAYMQRWDGRLPFDYVWFTPRFDRPDPCEDLKKHMDNRS